MKILDFVIALDGGTRVIDLELDNGKVITIGLDGRMDSVLSGRQLFIGASPDGPNTEMLAVGGSKEAEIIALLEKWLEKSLESPRQNALMAADTASLKGQDLLDRMAVEFLNDVRNRQLDDRQ